METEAILLAQPLKNLGGVKRETINRLLQDLEHWTQRETSLHVPA